VSRTREATASKAEKKLGVLIRLEGGAHIRGTKRHYARKELEFSFLAEPRIVLQTDQLPGKVDHDKSST